MKAVIPAAGLGTRFLPIAKAVPKEMLPVGNLPVIHYVVAEAAAAGFDEILIILSEGKESIREYFTPNPKLEAHLERVGKPREAALIREAASMARIEYTYQPEMRGLGDAVRLGRDFVGASDAFAVLLGDTIMHDGSPLPAMREAWEKEGKGSVGLEPCPADRVSRYGIAGGVELRPGVFALDRLVEKPKPEEAPRLLDAAGAPLPPHAFAARYLFRRDIFDFLDATAPGFGGEIQLTDAMQRYREQHGLLGVCWPGRRLDIGNPAGLLAAAQLLQG